MEYGCHRFEREDEVGNVFNFICDVFHGRVPNLQHYGKHERTIAKLLCVQCRKAHGGSMKQKHCCYTLALSGC